MSTNNRKEAVICRKCLKEKDQSLFNKRMARKNGLHPHCKSCVKEYKREYNSRLDVQIRTAEYRKKNRKPYKKQKPTPAQLLARREAQKTPEAKAARKEYLARPDVRERVLHLRRLRYQKKGRSVAEVIDGRMRVMIRRSLRTGKNNKSWRSLVDFSIEDFRSHMERQFTEGMSWDRFLSGDIEIDHILPVSSFNIVGPDCSEFKACWSLGNLRPLWKEDNNKKRSKVLFLV